VISIKARIRVLPVLARRRRKGEFEVLLLQVVAAARRGSHRLTLSGSQLAPKTLSLWLVRSKDD
jgi:hypothetical protein